MPAKTRLFSRFTHTASTSSVPLRTRGEAMLLTALVAVSLLGTDRLTGGTFFRDHEPSRAEALRVEREKRFAPLPEAHPAAHAYCAPGNDASSSAPGSTATLDRC